MTQMPKLTEMQSAAADRAYHLLQTYHAAIIAMPTGTGKTYIACRLIRMFADDPDAAATVVAPAHLLPMWRRAADAFGIHPRIASYQMLSLGRAAADAKAPILWIFDEAHALKNSNSKRYRFAQKHTAVHYVCLMTATPVSMSWNDICARRSGTGSCPLHACRRAIPRVCGRRWASAARRCCSRRAMKRCFLRAACPSSARGS